MPRPRKALVSAHDTPFYHCVSRCVRRAFLCGDDQYSGKNYDHRKSWLVDRIQYLSSIFAIDVCAYAVMSNHYHMVLHIHEAESKKWSDDEVFNRWTKLFKGPLLVQRHLKGESLCEDHYNTLSAIASTYRERLSDLSWFMRCLNEPIARDANQEDHCTGRFWEGRFKSQALLDMGAVLSCMAYVDLNPIRAGLTNSLESSDFTSIQQRLLEFSQSQQPVSNLEHKDTTERKPSKPSPPIKPLFPFIGHENINKTHAGLFLEPLDYFQLVNWSGRCKRNNKREFIPEEVSPILEKLSLPPELWLDFVANPTRSTLIRLKKVA